MNGNACRDVLESLDVLESDLLDENLSDITRTEIQLLVNSLRAFNKVRKSCFGEDLEKSYIEDINEFKEEYVKTGMSITTKIHIIFEHVKDFCTEHNKGLGHYSEQAG